MIRRAVCAVVISLVMLGEATSIQGAQELVWRKEEKKVDAAIAGWPVKRVLGRLAAVSGWKIFIEPGLDQTVSAEFKNVSQGDALKLLLTGFNYALVPQAKGGSRLYVYKTSVTEATAAISPEVARARNWIPNELILVKDPDSKEDIEQLVKELGGKIVATSEGLNAYRVQFEDAEAAEAARQKLADRDDLQVQDNYEFRRPGIASTATSSPASMFPLDSKPVSPSSQVTVALVDTAIQPLEGKMKDFLLPSVHVSDQPDALPAEPMHGTSMAQTILNSLAAARESGTADANVGTVRLLPIDIYGNSATTTTFEVSQGLYKAIQSGAQVVNLSLGGTGESPMVEYLLEMARKKQILVFASAGNTPTTDPTWPAASPNAIAVTATDWSGNIAPYANRGAFIDLKAPGSSRIYHNGQIYVSTGTSTATAFVSGQAAALASRGIAPMQTADAILRAFDVNKPAERRR
jgi:subtilisin family serine protease